MTRAEREKIQRARWAEDERTREDRERAKAELRKQQILMKHKARTQKEIAAEIVALKACKAYAPPYSMLGDDNHAEIDLQIKFLNGDIDTTTEDFNEFSGDDHSAVLRAEAWKNGDTNASPSSGWDGYKK